MPGLEAFPVYAARDLPASANSTNRITAASAHAHHGANTHMAIAAAENGLLIDHLRVHKAAREMRKARGTILAL